MAGLRKKKSYEIDIFVFPPYAARIPDPGFEALGLASFDGRWSLKRFSNIAQIFSEEVQVT